VAGDAEASADFISVMAGTLSPAAFFDPGNVGRIMGGGGGAATVPQPA
jgi:hypothetical protein